MNKFSAKQLIDSLCEGWVLADEYGVERDVRFPQGAAYPGDRLLVVPDPAHRTILVYRNMERSAIRMFDTEFARVLSSGALRPQGKTRMRI